MHSAIIIVSVWNVLNAFHDAHQLNKLHPITHKGNAILYCLTVVVAAFLGNCFWFIPGLFALRPLVFDNLLNVLRHKDLTYAPAKPESWVDQWEQNTFKKHIWERSNLFYLAILAINYFAPLIVKLCRI